MRIVAPELSEIQPILNNILDDLVVTANRNKGELIKMGKALHKMTDQRDYELHDGQVRYLLRAAIYQLHGYTRMEASLYREIVQNYFNENPEAEKSFAYEMYKATGLTIKEDVVHSAIRKKLREAIPADWVKGEILDRLDELLDKWMWE